MSVHACIAPALAPGMVRLVELEHGGAEPRTLADMPPARAREIARLLRDFAARAPAGGGARWLIPGTDLPPLYLAPDAARGLADALDLAARALR